MDCLHAKSLFSLYIDGLLPEGQKALLIEHAEKCEACGNELFEYKEMLSGLNGLKQAELPENYHEELMNKIGELQKRRFEFNLGAVKRFGAAVASITIALLVLGTANLFISRTESPSSGGMTARYDFNSDSDAGTENAAINSDKASALVPPRDETYESFESGADLYETSANAAANTDTDGGAGEAPNETRANAPAPDMEISGADGVSDKTRTNAPPVDMTDSGGGASNETQTNAPPAAPTTNGGGGGAPARDSDEEAGNAPAPASSAAAGMPEQAETDSHNETAMSEGAQGENIPLLLGSLDDTNAPEPRQAETDSAPDSSNGASMPENTHGETNPLPVSADGADTPESPQGEPENAADSPEEPPVNTPPAAITPPRGNSGSVNYVQPEMLVRHVNIEIYTDDLFETVKAINALNGYNVSSNVEYYSPSVTKQYGHANIVRRVGANELEFVRGILRDLGQVTSESENQSDYASEYMDLFVRASNAQSEITRLSTLIGKSETIDNIVYVENRISDIDWRLDSYMGRMREIKAQSSEPYINISVMANEPYMTFSVEPETFGEKMANAFKASLEFTRRFIEGFTIFVASSAVPLLVFAAFVTVVVLLVKKVRRLKK